MENTQRENKQLINTSNQKKTVLFYGFMFGYVLSFVFAGPVYIQVANEAGHYNSNYILIAMFVHMLGLLFAGVCIKKQEKALKVIRITISICIIGTPLFLVSFHTISLFAYGVVAFMSGIAVACWGVLYKECIPSENRLFAMADTLIIANVLMILAGGIATYYSPFAGLAISIGYLVVALFIINKIRLSYETRSIDEKNTNALPKPLILLFLFVMIITVDSGLMYGVFNTAYQSYEKLISWYWAVPYIAALIGMKLLSQKYKGTKQIYIAVTMIAIGFILFGYLKCTQASYIMIDTLLLGAAGILDLFWSSMVGESLEYTKNPVRMVSVGWSANVFGVFIGSVISANVMKLKIEKTSVTIIALAVVCISLILLPVLLMRLQALLKNHFYLSSFLELSKEEQNLVTTTHQPKEKLSEREKQILDLILLGKTNQMIADELIISENTVKTHVRNILGKYEVENRVQLISLFLQQIPEKQ